MSLISQNAITKDRFKSLKRKDLDEPSLMEEDGEVVEDKEELDLVSLKTKKKKKKNTNKQEDGEVEYEHNTEMKRYESILFGDLYSPVEFGKEDEDIGLSKADNSALFFTDRSADSVLSVYEHDGEFPSDINEDDKQRKPVWIDEEEEKTSINIGNVNRLRKLRKEEDEKVITGSTYVSRLRAQHVKMNPSTEWAQPDNKDQKFSSDDEDSDDDILKTNADLVVKGTGKLLPGRLEYSTLLDANSQEPSNGPINSVHFHRNAQLLLAGGLDRRLRFFQIDGKRNTKVQSVFIEDCPIRKAAFLPDGSQVIVAGRRKFFYSFDLVKAKMDKIGPLIGREEKSLESFEISPDSKTIAFIGNGGCILLVSTKTKELIGTLKMNGTARSLAFTNNGEKLLSSGGDGQIYHWDLRTRTCFHKGVDDGCINGTSLCFSPTGNLFAAGSDSGIVNIYNDDEFLGGKKKPMKTIANLTTKVDFMKFNNDAQILAIGSTMKKNSMKLIHIPSFTAFSNWPGRNRFLHYPRCLDFSPGGGFLTMANSAGKVYLYKLHHYNHA